MLGFLWEMVLQRGFFFFFFFRGRKKVQHFPPFFFFFFFFTFNHSFSFFFLADLFVGTLKMNKKKEIWERIQRVGRLLESFLMYLLDRFISSFSSSSFIPF